jgi:DNA (cytosine-5)-methyltransferase 1
MLTHFSLFTGIGGLDLAAEWAGFKTVGQCEWAEYPTKVLEKHWPGVPRWRDIRSVTAEDFYKRTGLRTVTVISGGFPCQPFSLNGERKGEDDDRFLWPEMCRVISEFKPTWVLGENVLGIVSMALDQVLSDLENLDYSTQAFVIPACAVGAPHRRDRTFIVANSNNNRRRNSKYGEGQGTAEREHGKGHTTEGMGIDQIWFREWKIPTPEFLRSINGVPNRVDRIKCCGNAVSPRQAYPIFKTIYNIEMGLI